MPSDEAPPSSGRSWLPSDEALASSKSSWLLKSEAMPSSESSWPLKTKPCLRRRAAGCSPTTKRFSAPAVHAPAVAELIGTSLGGLLPTGLVYLLLRNLIAGGRRTGFLAFVGVVLAALGSVIVCGIAAYVIVGHNESRNITMWLAYAFGGAVWCLGGVIRILQAADPEPPKNGQS